MTDTTLTPEAELEKLEQDAVDGKPVTAEQLATARARIDLAALVGRGKEKRDRAAAEKAANKARADAKEAVSGMLDGASDELLDAYDQAVAALEGLYTAHSTYQGKIQEAGSTLTRAGVPSRGWTHEPIPEHYDPKFSAGWAQGGIVSAVTVEGTPHHSGNLEDWVRAAIRPVLAAHYETHSLAGKIGSGPTPPMLTNRNA